MKIKPRFSTSDISFENVSAEVYVAKINTPSHHDPQGIISSGIYKVFHWEKIIYTINLIILSLIIIFCGLFIIGLVFNFYAQYNPQYQTRWTYYIIPTIIIIWALIKFSWTSIETMSLRKTLKYYRQNLLKDEKYTPTFIVRLYKKINLKQVNHNWMTIFILFYGTIITLLIWFLQDQIWLWGALNFKVIINSFFLNPTTMVIILISGLFIILFFYIFMLIIRKKRLTDIETFFGNDVIVASEITQLKHQRNKILFRFFWLSIAIILVVPIIVLWILKRFVLKK